MASWAGQFDMFTIAAFTVQSYSSDMPPAKRIKPSRLEMEVLEELWKLGSASIRELQESLPEDRRPEYTTVQTIVYRLEQKGAVERVKKIGNAHIFRPLVSRKSAVATLIDDFLRAIGGSRPLMAHLLESGQLSLSDLKELEKAAKDSAQPPPPAQSSLKNEPSSTGSANLARARLRRS